MTVFGQGFQNVDGVSTLSDKFLGKFNILEGLRQDQAGAGLNLSNHTKDLVVDGVGISRGVEWVGEWRGGRVLR